MQFRSFPFTECSYDGNIVRDRMEGEGTYTFKDGNRYEGQFKDGMFHGKGIIYFPSGARYVGNWAEGKRVSGQYIYSDELHYEKPSDWKYCHKDHDRRLWREIVDEKEADKEADKKVNVKSLEGIRPTIPHEKQVDHLLKQEARGRGKIVDQIPPGTYDALGEGYYDPTTGLIYEYEGKELRKASQEEIKEIKLTCRRVV